jgi:hypothetical protein
VVIWNLLAFPSRSVCLPHFGSRYLSSTIIPGKGGLLSPDSILPHSESHLLSGHSWPCLWPLMAPPALGQQPAVLPAAGYLRGNMSTARFFLPQVSLMPKTMHPTCLLCLPALHPSPQGPVGAVTLEPVAPTCVSSSERVSWLEGVSHLGCHMSGMCVGDVIQPGQDWILTQGTLSHLGS